MSDKEWYFNTVTEHPEQGKVSPISHRMGPYRTRQDAIDAWRIVKERNTTWNEATRQWNRWGKTGADGDPYDDDSYDDGLDGDDVSDNKM